MNKKRKGFFKFFTGVFVGAGLGVLFAPKKGSETRRELKLKIDEIIDEVKDIDVDEIREDIETKIFEIKMELEDLDKEKILKIAKKKANDIKDMAEDLVEYAVEKGTPILEEMATAIREKSIGVTKDVLEKLEKQNEKEEA